MEANMRYIDRNFQLPENHFFLLGPRGTGKSTLLKNHFKDALYIDLLQTDNFRKYSARPERLTEVVNAHAEKKIIIIDEIQKVPDLLSIIHSLIEKHDGRMYIMTGSSARKLRKQGTNLLAGRAYKKIMYPFTAMELKKSFNLIDALKYGMLPVILNSPDKNEALNVYVDLYIKEEVMMEGLTRNIGAFTRFLEAVSFSHGSILNIVNIARECQVGRKLVEAYIRILEDLMIAWRMPVFSKRAKRQLTVHPKFYFFDTGMYRKLRPSGSLDTPEEIEGVALEGLVLQNIKAALPSIDDTANIYFWRTKSGSEVDFIIYGDVIFTAIEVKSSRTIRPKDLRSLKSFKTDYPTSNSIILYRGKERFIRDDILIIPCEEFLMDMQGQFKI